MMKHGIEKCRVCDNYLRGVETCKFCSFEWAKDYPPTNDTEFDIFEMDDDIEWSHLQIMDRLKYKGINCLSADIWPDNNLAYVIGADANRERVAEALHIHKECVYEDGLKPLLIINLFQEKCLRVSTPYPDEDGEQFNLVELLEMLTDE